MRRRTGGILAGAALIAGVTVVARVAGFARWLVFSPTVGTTPVGDAYATANQLPNILYEVVAGGSLAAVMVPLLARPLADGDRRRASEIASGVLTWALTVLIPLGALLAAFAGPIARALVHDPASAALAARLLVPFAVQVPLYGVGVVLTGALQAGKRFFWPALAPLLSSVTVIGVYLAYGAVAGGHGQDPAALGSVAVAILGWGTTAGVAVLTLPLLGPALHSGLRLRPTYRLPKGVARRAVRLAVAGVGALVAQQLSVLAVVALANQRGGTGTLPTYNYAQAVYLLPYAVLAVPLATSAFPHLAAAAGRGVGGARGLASMAASTTRAVLAAGALGAAVLIAAAPGVQRVFAAIDASGQAAGLAACVTAFAPGLIGYGLVAHVTRVLYAADRPRAAVAATAAGWLVVAGASLGLSLAAPRGSTVAVVRALGGASAIGMTVAGAALLWAMRRSLGPAAWRGLGRSGLVAVLGAAVGAAAGRWLATRIGADGGAWLGLAGGAAGAVLAAAVLLVAVRAFDGGLMGEVVRIGRAEPARDTDGSGGPGREETLSIVELLARSDGGIRAHVGMLARALATDGRDRVVVCARADSQPRDLPAEVCQIGPWGLGRALAGADVVHAHGLRAGAAAVLMSRLTPGRRAGRRRRRARVVVTVHNRPGGSRWARAMGHALGPIVARGADQTLGVSSDLVDWLRGLGADNPERAFVPAPPLAEPVGRTSGAAPREVAGGGPLLLTVARLAPQKGLKTLLDAAALLKDGIVGFDGGCDVRCSPDGEPVHFTWVIAGEGPLRGALQQRIDAEHLPVRLLGRRDDLADWYRAADLVVSTAHWEGQPVALQEAMRAGAAIVATDVGGTAETVPAALLVRDAAAAVAEGVTWALTQPGLAERLRAASLEAAAHLPTSADMVAQARRAYAGLGSGESAG